MQAMRRLLRSVLTVLVLGVWSTTSIGAAVADVAVSSSASVVAHVESPDAAGDCAAAHAHDCAFCQALQWTSVAVAPTVVPAPPQTGSRVSVATTTARGRAWSASAVARAPPINAI